MRQALTFDAFLSSSADVLNSITKVEVQFMSSDEISDFPGIAIVRGGLGHCFTRLDTVLDSAKH